MQNENTANEKSFYFHKHIKFPEKKLVFDFTHMIL